MRYIKPRTSHTKLTIVNEELLGGVFKNLFNNIKSKIAINISKSIGSVAEIDNLLKKYRLELIKIREPKIATIKAIGELQLSIDNGGVGDQNEMKNLVIKYQKADSTIDKQIANAKAKYDKEMDLIIKNESSPFVKDYIVLKKFDMTQEFLQTELDMINNGIGLSAEQIEKSPTLQKMAKSLMDKAKEVSTKKIDIEKNIEAKNTDPANGVETSTPTEFDVDAAEKDEKYIWNSKFSNGEYKFTTGEAVKYWSNGNKSVTDAFYVDVDDAKLSRALKEDELLVTTTKDDSSKAFPILKGKIVSTDKDDAIKAKLDEPNSTTGEEDETKSDTTL